MSGDCWKHFEWFFNGKIKFKNLTYFINLNFARFFLQFKFIYNEQFSSKDNKSRTVLPDSHSNHLWNPFLIQRRLIHWNEIKFHTLIPSHSQESRVGRKGLRAEFYSCRLHKSKMMITLCQWTFYLRPPNIYIF